MRMYLTLLLVVSILAVPALGQNSNPFGFTGHEYDTETGLYYMKGRYYDPQTGRFLSPDPAKGDPRIPGTLHPYLYALNNPLVYVDPDGHEVRALDELALERIKSTLPADLQDAVQTNDEGLLLREPINAVETDDPNFLALRELVNHTNVTAVQTAPEIRFLTPEGEVDTQQFLYNTPEKIRADLVAHGISPEEAERLIPPDAYDVLGGFFVTPRDDAANTNPHDDRKDRSFTNEATAIVPDDSVAAIPDVENAKSTAHELYGHGLLYQRGEPFTHPPVPEAHFGEIQDRTEATYNQDLTGLVTENPNGPGGRVVPFDEDGRQDPRRR